MSIARYDYSLNDFAPTSFSSMIDRFFNESLSRKGGSQYSFVPRVDIIEDETAFQLHVAVPGMNREDIKIDLNKNQLTVSGERKTDVDEKLTYHAIETPFGAFSRSFILPENIDTENISAKYNNGILVITLPKDQKKLVKTTIKVA